MSFLSKSKTFFISLLLTYILLVGVYYFTSVDIWTDDGWKEDEAYKRVVQRDKKIHELYKLFSVLSSLIDAEVANREEKRKFKELKKFFALLEKHEHLGGEFPKFPDLENKSIIKAIINIFK